ncbi:MAG: transcriptional regulator [Deltaproteobacteria bacterium RIFCSPLOWO2_12_FULL_40_28]|nr:MAG: transcriptional regulator [Deltaproteobacteria bacterium RIFCSPHIGHO2_02_FULL_40_28]OGQ20466.1 MAG: transcriptional regulator [Deltaproteobacteria bacterium RIFCSPHIGHO2_12_FULL_40_32]OGQ41096.1 MAG: transcriptional regulator [Deltaproteobacteria bacterium RIFCSPLOWO2_02_FULL_40_36]OGQ55076.1 MAG: transcriptional regulator [Deltaproteobacteria bacterium RIFCSPLOWO2_12_FULL_40_28]
MPVISRFFGILIAIYWDDHAPPHFHAKYSGEEAVIEIKIGQVIKGNLSKKALALVEEWRQSHVDELMADWELARQRKPLNYIEPLE